MTSRAPNWFEQKYVQGATHVLQDQGYRLKGTTAETDNIKGNTVTWKLAGKGAASKMSGTLEHVTVMNADRTTVVATMDDYEANDWIKTTDIEKMTESEQTVAQQTAAYAMGRKFDNLVMAVMDAAAGAITTIDTSAGVPSIVDTITAQGQILAQGFAAAPEIYIAIPQMVMLQLELYREFASADYAGNEAMLKLIGARTYKGATYIPLPDEQFSAGASGPGAGKVDYYVWLKACVGFVPNYALQTRIDYVPQMKAYLAANTMGAVAQILQATGIRRIRSQLPTALARPTL